MGFSFWLARELSMTVRELDERMDHAEFVEWFAFKQLIDTPPEKRKQSPKEMMAQIMSITRN